MRTWILSALTLIATLLILSACGPSTSDSHLKSIVNKWNKSHPEKVMLSDLLEMKDGGCYAVDKRSLIFLTSLERVGLVKRAGEKEWTPTFWIPDMGGKYPIKVPYYTLTEAGKKSIMESNILGYGYKVVNKITSSKVYTPPVYSGVKKGCRIEYTYHIEYYPWVKKDELLTRSLGIKITPSTNDDVIGLYLGNTNEWEVYHW